MLSEGAGIREEGGTSHMNVHYVNIFIKCEVQRWGIYGIKGWDVYGKVSCFWGDVLKKSTAWSSQQYPFWSSHDVFRSF